MEKEKYICNNCGKDFEYFEINALGICNNCFFEVNFKHPDKIREVIADSLEEYGEMLLADSDKHLNKVGEKLKMYSVVIDRL